MICLLNCVLWLICFNGHIEKCDHDLFRNTAVETVEQELLFVGTENGKLLAVREIVKKVRKPRLACISP